QSCTTTGATQCDIVGLENGTAYTLGVVASNANGDGPAGSAAAAVTPAGPPSAPTDVVVARNVASATVSWSPPADDGGSPITGYTVTAQPGGASCTVSGNPPPTSCTIEGLDPTLDYSFAVVASNGAGTGAPGGAGGGGGASRPQ